MTDRRIPVHVMRRFFNYLIGKAQGIEIAHRSGGLHTVSVHFETSADASGFYRALSAIYSDHGGASKDLIIKALTQLLEAKATAEGEAS